VSRYLDLAEEILELQAGMIQAVIDRREMLDQNFWERFDILTQQFCECRQLDDEIELRKAA
jgi:hypothetical protein